MSRGLSATNATSVSAATGSDVFFVEMQFTSGTIRVHSRLGTITWGGYDWDGVGLLGSIGALEEDSDLGRSTMTLALSGVQASMVSTALGESYQGRTAIVYIGQLSLTTNALLDTPHELKRGAMDVMEFDESGESFIIRLTVEDETAAWDRAVVRRYNNADQQMRFPGDKGLEFIEQMVEKELVWRFN